MLDICPGCHELAHWYQRRGGGKDPYNSCWHRRCAISVDGARNEFFEYADLMCRRYNHPIISELQYYSDRRHRGVSPEDVEYPPCQGIVMKFKGK